MRFPDVPILFCETRPLAQEWTYRFLGAALDHHASDLHAAHLADALPEARPLRAPEVTATEIRAWAAAAGYEVAPKGRLRPEIRAAYDAAHQSP